MIGLAGFSGAKQAIWFLPGSCLTLLPPWDSINMAVSILFHGDYADHDSCRVSGKDNMRRRWIIAVLPHQP